MKEKKEKSLLAAIKEINRTVLEMEIGIVAVGILFQIGSVVFPGDRLARALSILLGSVLAAYSVVHMYRTLDRALDLDEKSAQKAIYSGYIVRYLTYVLVIAGAALTNWLNPLLTFLGLMSLKFTAYLQPFVHKLCNKAFHETDPEESEEVME